MRQISLVAAAATALVIGACAKKQAQTATVETVPAQRQNVVVDVEATGAISPINAIDVRSKASGQIMRMPVQTGSIVRPGDLLVSIDPRDAQNRYDQAAAALRAANSTVTVTRAQYTRAQELSKQGVITAPELESATIAYSNAQSQAVAARTQVELAQVALEDVTIRAPINGSVIAKSVSEGQVIASATNSASGGTVLLRIANLATVYDSTLVSESDIGKVKPGQTATVTVDAYPNRIFRGVVEKIEPTATVQQSVTMFPVLIRLENPDGALMPGMNTDVSVLVDERQNVVAVPVDAVRTLREASTAATALGLDPQQVASAVQQQGGTTGGGRTASAGAVAADTPTGVTVGATRGQGARDSSARRAGQARGAGNANANGGGGQFAGRGGRGGAGGAGGFSGGGRSSKGLVFVKSGTTYEPRVVTLGISNYDVSEIVSGLKEGEQVALVSAAVLQQNRTQQQDQIRSRVGVPGIGAPAGGAGGGAAGGRAGGGGGGGGAPRGGG